MTSDLPEHVISAAEKYLMRHLDLGPGTWCGRCRHVKDRHTSHCTGFVPGDKRGRRHWTPCQCSEFTMEIQRELVAMSWPHLLEDRCREDDEERSGEYHDPHGFLTLPPHGEEV